MSQHLAEVFLTELNFDYSRESVTKAMEACQKNLEERLQKINSPIGHVLYFLEPHEAGGGNETEHFYEIRAFWDVAKEFDCREFTKYEIVRLARRFQDLVQK